MRAVALLTLLGCQKAPGPARQKCTAETAEFAKWMQALAADGYGDVLMARNGIRVVTVDHKVPVTRLAGAPILTLTPSEVAYNGSPVMDPRNLVDGQDLQGLQAVAKGEGILVQIDKEVRWRAVRVVLRTLGTRRVTFVFERTSRLPHPGPSSIDEEIRRYLRGPLPASRPGELVEKVYGRCPEARAVLTKVAQLEGEGRDVAMTVELPRAIEKCRCKVDFAAARAFHWYTTGRNRSEGQVLAGRTVQLEADGAVLPISPDTRWGDAYRQVLAATADGKPIRP